MTLNTLKNQPKKLHTYGSWEVFFLCSPDCPKQPRTSFPLYKLFYPKNSGRISDQIIHVLKLNPFKMKMESSLCNVLIFCDFYCRNVGEWNWGSCWSWQPSGLFYRRHCTIACGNLRQGLLNIWTRRQNSSEITSISNHMWTFNKIKYMVLNQMSGIRAMHTVSFDWFLSGLEWILSFEFCLLKVLIFYQKSL